MTETIRTEPELCHMGRKTANPCPYPATESLPGLLPGDGPHLCAYHAATEPLNRELDELSLSLELAQTYLKGARHQRDAGPLVTILERAVEDFSERLGIVDKVLEDLKTAEHLLMRG